jgi:hypothetical protein
LTSILCENFSISSIALYRGSTVPKGGQESKFYFGIQLFIFNPQDLHSNQTKIPHKILISPLQPTISPKSAFKTNTKQKLFQISHLQHIISPHLFIYILPTHAQNNTRKNAHLLAIHSDTNSKINFLHHFPNFSKFNSIFLTFSLAFNNFKEEEEKGVGRSLLSGRLFLGHTWPF